MTEKLLNYYEILGCGVCKPFERRVCLPYC